ncbi:MAG: hypothetical protein ACOZNI_24345 [Myxococcota bacterium]
MLLLLAACPTADPEPKEADPQWWATCGDPVCHDSGWVEKDLPDCTDEAAGAACETTGEACDPHDPCNSTLLCATEDPATTCPISLRSAKRDVRYLDPAELAALGDRLVDTRLAAWRYVGDRDDGRVHYGFVIDDDPTLPAVDARRGVVDLYTWATMSAAALQVQQARIDALEKRLAAIEAGRPKD